MLIIVSVAVLLGIGGATVAPKFVEPEMLDTLLMEGRHEEFSYHLGIPNPDLARSSNERSLGLDPRFHKELKEGDMIVSDSKETARQAIDLFQYSGSRWPREGQTTIVPVSISSNFSEADRRNIHKGMIYWNQMVSKVQVVNRRTQKDFVFIFPGDGCWSHMARRGNQQPMSLGQGCVDNGTFVHEMEHAIGLTHEQNRSDRDDYIIMKWGNIPANWKDQYEKNNQQDYIQLGDYDCYSIMHYPYLAPETNKPAFEFRKSGCDVRKVGTGNAFTDTDVYKINRLYTY